MTKGERLVGEVALVALYLRGAPFVRGVQRRRWPLVVDAVRGSCADLCTLPDALRSLGLWDEAALLSDSAVMDWALSQCSSGSVLTFFDPAYPLGWTSSLGAGAPPCLWRRGALPHAPPVAVVGSRVLDAVDRSLAAGLGRLLMRRGRTLVSGGAVGADSVAMDAALSCGDQPRCVEVLPCGLDSVVAREGVCQLSACEPWATFTPGQAMERNALLYAFGRRTFVVRARLRTGGTWHGAVDALRRRLGAVHVCERDEASSALVRLGARGFGRLTEVPALLESPVPEPQPTLFGANVVRAGVAPYGFAPVP